MARGLVAVRGTVMELNVHAIDVADYQPANLGQLIQAYQVKHVVPHLYMPGEGTYGPQRSKDQINSTRDNDATSGGYVFPYTPRDNVDWYFQNTLELCASVNLALPVGFVDAEYTSPTWPGPDERWMDGWVERAVSVDMVPGLYCNPDWFVKHPEFHKYGLMGVVLWLANWDHIADVAQGWIPSGWEFLAGKQWEVSPDYGLGEIDRDVFREEYTVYQQGTPEPPPPPPDPCANEKERLVSTRDKLVQIRDTRPYKAVSQTKVKELIRLIDN